LQFVFSRKSFVASFKVAFKRFFFRVNPANVATEFVIIRESRRTERAFLQILLIVVSSFVAHQRRVKPERFAAQVAQERAVSFVDCRDMIFEIFFRPEKPVAALILARMKMRLFAQVLRQNRHFVAAEIAARTFNRRRFFVDDVDIRLVLDFQNCFLVRFASPMFVLFPFCFEAQVANVARKWLKIRIKS
jgi:hypothetical protein